MRIFVKAKPNAFENKVLKIDDQNYVVSVTELPVQGRANRAIIEELSNYFSTNISNVNIISGRTSRNKIIEINI